MKIKKRCQGLLTTLTNVFILMNYSASATTSFTSGIMRFIIPSIPAFNVIMEEGHPLQLPCIIKFTTPSL